jgi:hypothetical protein
VMTGVSRFGALRQVGREAAMEAFWKPPKTQSAPLGDSNECSTTAGAAYLLTKGRYRVSRTEDSVRMVSPTQAIRSRHGTPS